MVRKGPICQVVTGRIALGLVVEVAMGSGLIVAGKVGRMFWSLMLVMEMLLMVLHNPLQRPWALWDLLRRLTRWSKDMFELRAWMSWQ